MHHFHVFYSLMLVVGMVKNKLKGVSFYRYLINEGYYFDKNIIENYLLSLKVKPFVILTGNSGTGKTKLSQLFAKYLQNTGSYNDDLNEYITVTAPMNYSSWWNKGWTLSSEYFDGIFPLKECNVHFNFLVDGIPAKGYIAPWIQLEYVNEEIYKHIEKLSGFDLTSLIDEESKNKEIKKIFRENDYGDLTIKILSSSLRNLYPKDYIDPNGSIKYMQKSNDSAVNKRQWLINNKISDYLPFIYNRKVPCEIIVNGIKSDAKIRFFTKLQYDKNEELQNHLNKKIGEEVSIELKIEKFGFDKFESKLNPRIYDIIPVGANWTDNTNIIGYFNAITEKYQSTPAYDLIIKAQKNKMPYFLILDEMNLSHVERYFADFLSAIESKEPIPIFGESNKSLMLPNNLFIIGTVNVDETTYMFSPKVLDRANTIEFDTLSVSDYINSNREVDDFEGDVKYLQSPLIDSDISNLNVSNLKEILSKISCAGGNLLKILINEMDKFQSELKSIGFDFGFRVINEILRFMVVAWIYENSPDNWDNWERYFDAQIKQKILPKIHGSQKAIGNTLNNLFNLCLVDRDNNEQAKLFNITENNCKYYTSALKLQNMAKVLSDQRYVSFIN